MKRVISVFIAISMLLSLCVSANASVVIKSDNNRLKLHLDLSSVFAGNNAALFVLNDGYDIGDLNDANYENAVEFTSVQTVNGQGDIDFDFELENLNKMYMFVVQCGDITLKRKLNPASNTSSEFNKIWINTENGNININGRIIQNKNDKVTVKMVRGTSDSQTDSAVVHIAVLQTDRLGYIVSPNGKKGYTFNTDVSEKSTLSVFSDGLEIYRRELEPQKTFVETESGDVLDIDFELDEVYPALTGTTKERFEQAVNELPDEIKVVEPVEIGGDYELFVSPNGNDANSGSFSKPLKTIRKAIELRNRNFGTSSGVVIYLRGGEYYLDDTLSIDGTYGKDDNGGQTNEKPLIISSYNNEKVYISTGNNLNYSAFKKVTDHQVLKRLNENVREDVRVASFDDLGIKDKQILKNTKPADVAFFSNGERMNVARWPDASNVYIGEIVNPGLVTLNKSAEEIAAGKQQNPEWMYTEFKIDHGKFYPDTNTRPLSWEEPEKVWIKGHIINDYTVNTMRVKSIGLNENKNYNTIKLDGYSGMGALKTPVNNSGEATNKFINYFYFNVLEELDSPGEFYIDNENELMYFYPPSNTKMTNLVIYAGTKPVISLKNTSNIVINGVNIRYSPANGIAIEGGYQNIIQNCEISDLGGNGIVITGGRRNGVMHSTMKNNNGRAVAFNYNEEQKKNLTPTRNFMQNCYTYRCPLETSSSGVAINGVGIIVSHNLVTSSSFAPIGTGDIQECIIEYNEVTGGPTNTWDSAGIYIGGSRTNRGNHIRYNYVHDLSKTTTVRGLTGIYFDDTGSDNYGYGNIIKNVPAGLYSHNGNENVFFNNVIIGGEQTTGYYIRDEFNYLAPLSYRDRTSADNYYNIGISSEFTNGVSRLWAKNYYKEQNSYIDDLVYGSEAWQRRYPTLKFYADNARIIQNQFEQENRDLNAHVITPREVYLRTSYDSYYANNVYYRYEGQPTNFDTDSINQYHIRLAGRSTNVIFDHDPGFVDLANNNLNFNDNAEIFSVMTEKVDSSIESKYDENLKRTGETYTNSTTIPAFVAPPFDKMGLTDSFNEKERIPFKMITAITPTGYVNAAETSNVITFKWRDSGISNYYRVSVSSSESFANAVQTITDIPSCEIDISSLPAADKYYWKVEGLGNTKAFNNKYNTASTFTFTTKENDILIDSVTFDVGTDFNSDTVINAKITVANTLSQSTDAVLLVASYGSNGEFLRFTPVNISIPANSTITKDVTLSNPDKDIDVIKIFVWDNMAGCLKPYSKLKVFYN